MKRSLSSNPFLVAAALGAGLVCLPLAATAELSAGDPLGTTEPDIRAALQDLGYIVNEIEFEDDEIEAEVTLNGVDLEIEIDPATGKITEVEHDDD